MPKKIERILPFRTQANPAESLRGLLSLGPKTSIWLAEIGISTVAQVREMGPIGACRRMLLAGRPVSVVMAYVLEAALSGCRWDELPAEAKETLRVEFAKMKNELRIAVRARPARSRGASGREVGRR